RRIADTEQLIGIQVEHRLETKHIVVAQTHVVDKESWLAQVGCYRWPIENRYARQINKIALAFRELGVVGDDRTRLRIKRLRLHIPERDFIGAKMITRLFEAAGRDERIGRREVGGIELANRSGAQPHQALVFKVLGFGQWREQFR